MLIALTAVLGLVLLFSSILVHEAGHWMVLRRHGVQVVEFGIGLGPRLLRVGRFSVGLIAIGAFITPNKQQFEALPADVRVRVALAGPWLSAIYGSLLLICATNLSLTPAQQMALNALGGLNWLIALLNLIPIPPLDGFRALEYWLEHRQKPIPEKVLRRAYRLGNGLVFGVGFGALGLAFARTLHSL